MQQPVYILMGVSGCGKTTIGRQLAAATKLAFYDADDFHPPANRAKMAGGQPLNDEDRAPWLAKLAREIAGWLAANQGAVLACSALKAQYRTQLQGPSVDGIRWVFLDGAYDLIHKRLCERSGHFFPGELLQSQFETLERPERALVISVAQTPEQIVREILEAWP